MNDYPNTSHINRVLVSNTLKCFPRLWTITLIFLWETYIVKKMVPTISGEGIFYVFDTENDNNGGK
jgi:hypothetical protein